MLKPRQVLGAKADGTLVSLHLSEDAVAAGDLFKKLRANGPTQGVVRIELRGPWGLEKSHNFPPAVTELKPAKAVKA
jgi:hypothetical protein